MNPLPTEDELFEEAMTLVIRLQHDPGNPAALQAVQRWRARSQDHERVWQEVAEIHGMAGKVLNEQRGVARRAKLGLTRRNLVIGATLGLGAYVAADTVIPKLMLAARADQTTDKGEIRSVRLPDGSMVTMGPESAIALAFSENSRRVDLLEGMSYFDIVDERRPFEARVDDVSAKTSGAAFEISNDGGYLAIGVGRGKTEVSLPRAAFSLDETVGAGGWLGIQEDRRVIDRGSRSPSQIGAWRDGMIVADNETVTAVIARIARWQRGRIVMVGATFGSRRVSGIYDLNHPVAAVEAVVEPFGGVVRQISSFLTVISPV